MHAKTLGVGKMSFGWVFHRLVDSLRVRVIFSGLKTELRMRYKCNL